MIVLGFMLDPMGYHPIGWFNVIRVDDDKYFAQRTKANTYVKPFAVIVGREKRYVWTAEDYILLIPPYKVTSNTGKHVIYTDPSFTTPQVYRAGNLNLLYTRTGSLDHLRPDVIAAWRKPNGNIHLALVKVGEPEELSVDMKIDAIDVQGNLTILRGDKLPSDLIVVDTKELQFFNHTIKSLQAFKAVKGYYIYRNYIRRAYIIQSSEKLEISSPEHGLKIVDPGTYLIWHPIPKPHAKVD